MKYTELDVSHLLSGGQRAEEAAGSRSSTGPGRRGGPPHVCSGDQVIAATFPTRRPASGHIYTKNVSGVIRLLKPSYEAGTSGLIYPAGRKHSDC